MFRKGHLQYNTGKIWFRKGHIPALKGTKGIARSNKTSFKKGHNAGINHHRYNNGLCFDKRKKRVLIWCRDNTYQIFSRAVMECFLKRKLKSNEIVHHVNENPLDNRIENLRLVSRIEHIKIHKIREKRGKKNG